jgi:hypothetical protein
METAAFRMSWGNWGLRARIKWRRFEIFSSYAQDDKAEIIFSSLGIMAILGPTCPKALFSAAVTAQ